MRRAPKRLGKTRTLSPARKPAQPIHPPRAGTKQSRLIDLLRRPQGMTIAQACAALGWKAHTVRGAMAGALKGRLRLKIASEKPETGDRVYRIID
nr:DUF3489 domain-containing protein [Nitrosomonas nitrosa]